MREEFGSARSVPEIMKGMLDFSRLLEKSGTDASLAELVKTRASQINGARRIHMRAIDGEKSDNLLAGWRWSPLYRDRERAALAWTEALTVMAEGQAPDAAFADVRRQFSDPELVQLTLTIAIVNAWNRVATGLRLMDAAMTIDAEARSNPTQSNR